MSSCFEGLLVPSEEFDVHAVILMVILCFELMCRLVQFDALGIPSYIYDNSRDIHHGAGPCSLVQ